MPAGKGPVVHWRQPAGVLQSHDVELKLTRFVDACTLEATISFGNPSAPQWGEQRDFAIPAGFTWGIYTTLNPYSADELRWSGVKSVTSRNALRHARAERAVTVDARDEIQVSTKHTGADAPPGVVSVDAVNVFLASTADGAPLAVTAYDFEVLPGSGERRLPQTITNADGFGSGATVSPLPLDGALFMEAFGGNAASPLSVWPLGLTNPHFMGGVFDGTGIWLPPLNSDRILRVSTAPPYTMDGIGPNDGNTVAQWPPGFTPPGSSLFAGGAFDGTHVWMVPHDSDRGLRVSVAAPYTVDAFGPATNTFAQWPTGFTKAGAAFRGTTYDGRFLWMIPFAADRLVRMDTRGPYDATAIGPASDTISQWPPGYAHSGSAFSGGAFDGTAIWLSPYNADRVLRASVRAPFDVSAFGPPTNTLAQWPPTFGATGAGSWSGAVFDGEAVWFVPQASTYVLRVQIKGAFGMDALGPASFTISAWPVGYVHTTSAFAGGAYDGKSIWLVPASADRLIRIPAMYPHTMEAHGPVGAAWPAGFVKSGASFAGGVFDGTQLWLVPGGSASALIRLRRETPVARWRSTGPDGTYLAIDPTQHLSHQSGLTVNDGTPNARANGGRGPGPKPFYGTGVATLDDPIRLGPIDVNITNETTLVLRFGSVGESTVVDGTALEAAPPFDDWQWRLSGGGRNATHAWGRVEMRPGAAAPWGTVCVDTFSFDNAVAVICHRAGYTSTVDRTLRSDVKAGGPAGSGPIWLDDVECAGDETWVSQCRHAPLGTHNCVHAQDVSIECQVSVPDTSSYRYTLENTIDNGTHVTGKLMVLPSSAPLAEWGAVCSDNFDAKGAVAGCISAGFTNGVPNDPSDQANFNTRVVFFAAGFGTWYNASHYIMAQNVNCNNAKWGPNSSPDDHDLSFCSMTTDAPCGVDKTVVLTCPGTLPPPTPPPMSAMPSPLQYLGFTHVVQLTPNPLCDTPSVTEVTAENCTTVVRTYTPLPVSGLPDPATDVVVVDRCDIRGARIGIVGENLPPIAAVVAFDPDRPWVDAFAWPPGNVTANGTHVFIAFAVTANTTFDDGDYYAVLPPRLHRAAMNTTLRLNILFTSGHTLPLTMRVGIGAETAASVAGAPPQLTHATGCPLLAHPNTGLCDTNKQNVTLHGAYLAPTTVDYVELVDALREEPAPCDIVAFGENFTSLTCEVAYGFGQGRRPVLYFGGRVAAVAPQPWVAAVSFTPANELLCAFSVKFNRTCGVGECVALLGSCDCPTNYTGAACDQCVSSNFGPTCAEMCPSLDGTPATLCASRGVCGPTGNCTCQAGYAGPGCEIECPGTAANPCSNHGVCDAWTGTCTCDANATAGFWSGANCTTCVNGFGGTGCKTACPVGGGSPCSGGAQGACSAATASCVCMPGFCGLACELTSCTNCGNGNWGPACTTPCPGGAATPCNGNGVCDDAMLTTAGKCTCSVGWAGAACNVPCPGGVATPCNGHGACQQTTATCACNTFYAGSACNIACPGFPSPICSGHGTCAHGSTNFGTCTCSGGYAGTACNVPCPNGAANPCGGHGVCNQDVTCTCHASPATGYWGGANCTVCASGWTGPSCNKQCGFAPSNGLQCGGTARGTCTPAIVCQCKDDAVAGHWTGATCDECLPGWYGAGCLNQCPGGACNPCNGRGTCYEGRTNTGTCDCVDSNVTGHWSGADCSLCAANYYGQTCLNRCPFAPTTGTFCGRGVCNDGNGGNGACVCVTGWAKATGSDLCLVCAPGYFGPSCASVCPGGAGALACSGHGSCDGGLAGSGLCTCDFGYKQASCNVLCPNSGGLLCGGHGTCNTLTGSCAPCATGFAENFTAPAPAAGACIACAANRYGPSCLACPACVHGTCDSGVLGTGTCKCNLGYYGTLCQAVCVLINGQICNGHGTCRQSDGACDCDSNALSGFWQGQQCDSCQATHVSAACTVPCPTFGGLPCNGRGVCSEGMCSACNPLPTDVAIAYCGSACEQTNQACSTNNCPAGFWGAGCASQCVGYSVNSLECSNNGFCKDNGECACNKGFGGDYCQTSCGTQVVDGVTATCFGHGSCTVTGCVCLVGYTGANCEAVCPGISDPATQTPCNGRAVSGNCLQDGTCGCVNGFKGKYCQFTCPGGANECGGNGVCNDNGMCDCRPGFSGVACQDCSVGRFGQQCESICNLNGGQTVGRACVCFAGRANPDCSTTCMGELVDVDTGGKTYCYGHGICNETNRGDGRCTCQEDYYMSNCSVHCNAVSKCLQTEGLVHGVCNVNGDCVCMDDPLLGRYGGPTCNDCRLFFWGPTCTLNCPCNGNGGCNRETGACQCFDDDVRGHWAGVACSRCADGYIGTTCQGLNIQMSKNVEGSADVSVMSKGRGKIYLRDPKTNVTYVGGWPLMLLNASTNPLTPCPLAPPAGLDFGGLVAQLSLPTPTTVEVMVVEAAASNSTPARLTRIRFARGQVPTIKQVLRMDVGTLTSAGRVFAVQEAHGESGPMGDEDVAEALQAARTFHGLAAGPDVQATINYTDTAGATSGLVFLSSMRLLVVPDTTVPNGPNSTYIGAFPTYVLPAAITRVVNARIEVNGAGDSILIAAGSGPVGWAACFTRMPLNAATHGGPTGAGWDCAAQDTASIAFCNGNACPQVDHCTIFDRQGGDRVICVAEGAAGPAVLSFSLPNANVSIRPPVLAERHFTAQASPNAGATLVVIANPYDITALTVDPLPDIALGYVAFNEELRPSTIYKFNVDTLVPTGTYDNGFIGSDPAIVTAMEALPETRELHTVVVLPFRTSIISLNLFGIRTVEPNVIDARGGVPVVVQGEGFTAFTTTRCVFAGSDTRAIVPATILSVNNMTCIAPPSVSDPADCSVINFNIEFGGRRTQTTNAPIVRPPTAKPLSLVTSYGDRDLVSAYVGVRITLVGFGFVPTKFGRCRVTQGGARNRPPMVFPGNAAVFNSTHAACTLPADTFTASVPPARLEYSHDGTVYSEVAPVFAIAGEARALRVKVPANRSVTLRATEVAQLPPIEAHVVDALDNSLRWYADAPHGQGPFPGFIRSISNLTFGNGSVTEVETVRGVATFDTLTVNRPKAGRYEIETVVQAFSQSWVDTATVIIVAGDPARVSPLDPRAVAGWRIGTFQTETLSIEAVITDVAGNPTRDDLSVIPDRIRLEWLTAEETVNGALVDSVQTLVASARNDGAYQFPQVRTRGLFGHAYLFRMYPLDTKQFYIAAWDSPLIPLRRCAPVLEYGVLNDWRCARCPDHGICDGTERVQVEPYYWRAAADAYTFYSCRAPHSADACLGGVCIEGYAGPRCSVCAPGYGRTGLRCQPCAGQRTQNIILISLLVLGIAVVVALLVFSSVQHPHPEFGLKVKPERTPLVFKMLANHLQLSVPVAATFIHIPPQVETMYRAQASASSLDFNFAFVDCETDTNFYSKWITVIVAPLALGVVVLVFVAAAEWLRRRRSAYEAQMDEEARQMRLDTERRRQEFFFDGDGDASGAEAPRDYDAFDDFLDAVGKKQPKRAAPATLDDDAASGDAEEFDLRMPPEYAAAAAAAAAGDVAGSGTDAEAPGPLRASDTFGDSLLVDGGPKAVDEETADAGTLAPPTYHERVLAMYAAYAPAKATDAHVESALAKYVGNEERMLRKLVKKYGPEPLLPPSGDASDLRPKTVDTVAMTSRGPSFAGVGPGAGAYSPPPTGHPRLRGTASEEDDVGVAAITPAAEEEPPGGGVAYTAEEIEDLKQRARAHEARVLAKEAALGPEHQRRYLDAAGIWRSEAQVKESRKFDVFEILLVSAIIVVFLFYQTIVDFSALMLQCEELDFGATLGMRRVLVADRSIDCDSATHRAYTAGAYATLIVVGVLYPIAAVGLAKVVAVWRMGGDLKRARFLFHFMTGGYTDHRWYWEAAILVRKAIMVLIVGGVRDIKLRTYLASWMLALSLTLNSKLHPFADSVLAKLEMVSVSTILFTINIGLLYEFYPSADGKAPGMFWVVTVAILAVNIATLLAFVAALLHALYYKFQRMYRENPNQLFFLGFLFSSEADEANAELDRKVVDLEQEIAGLKALIAEQVALSRRSRMVEQLADDLTTSYGEVEIAKQAVLRWQQARLDAFCHAQMREYTAQQLGAIVETERQLANVALTLTKYTQDQRRRAVL